VVAIRRDRAGRAPLGCIGTMLIFGVFIYAVSKVGMPWLKYQQFHDEMHADAQFAVNLPDSIIRNRIMLRADSLRLPPEAKKSLVIRRNKAQKTILIQSKYSITVHFFLLGDKVFTFRPKVEEAI
jgi:hypothetical protein